MGILDRFKKKKAASEGPLYVYTENEMAQFEAYIEENFGKIENVLHEIVSPDIHCDILMVPPTEEAPYYKLFTMGMGAYEMNVPKELKQYELERAEMVVFLPPDWDIRSGKEEDYWPIRQLKVLARLPLQCDTWLGFGHTVSTDEKNSPYADNTKFCSIMLLYAINNRYERLDNLRIKGKGKINFYQMLPLYQEELEYKQNKDAETLLQLFDDEDILPVINIKRKNYCNER
ncbi:MAG: suppressor of fused domain protein [Lachnoclostridium sp.]|nr:suppressor of fused domain protein [Lachnospira sp.]MCM1249291.1 suppressor of fused domain protein [Lachnoclostridium sp.]